MYFEDLTPCSYGRAPSADVLSVGWLSRDHTFAVGPAPQPFVDALAELASRPVNLYRGVHLCEFRPSPPKVLSEGGIPMIDPLPGTAGNGEIHVTDGDLTYVAPVMVLHYVTAHSYLPPAQFIRAVEVSNRRPNTSLERSRER
jgi:hypothetical protein